MHVLCTNSNRAASLHLNQMIHLEIEPFLSTDEDTLFRDSRLAHRARLDSFLSVSFINRSELNIDLAEKGKYATGILFFLDHDPEAVAAAEKLFQDIALNDCGLRILTWRDVPRNRDCIGEVAKSTEPIIRQVFIVPDTGSPLAPAEDDKEEFKRKVGQVSRDL